MPLPASASLDDGVTGFRRRQAFRPLRDARGSLPLFSVRLPIRGLALIHSPQAKGFPAKSAAISAKFDMTLPEARLDLHAGVNVYTVSENKIHY